MCNKKASLEYRLKTAASCILGAMISSIILATALSFLPFVYDKLHSESLSGPMLFRIYMYSKGVPISHILFGKDSRD